MEFKWDKLQSHLDAGLARLYYIAGDEFTLVNDAYDLIKSKATKDGFSEVSRFDIGEFNWDEIRNSAMAQSLFGDKRLFDVVLGRTGMDRTAVDAIEDLLNEPVADLVIIVRGAKFEWRQRQNKWFKTLSASNEVGVCIGESLRPYEVDRWIVHKAQVLGLRLERAVVDQLATLNEGNVEAINQELKRLALIHVDTETPVSTQEINVVDGTIGNTFELLNRVFAGDVESIQKLFPSLQHDDRNFFPLHGALVAKLRQAISLKKNPKARMSKTQKANLERFLRRTDEATLSNYFNECANIDSQQKGIHRGSGWTSMRALLLEIAGSGGSNLETNNRWLRIDYEHKSQGGVRT